jgi:hypothetical protein
VDQQLAAQLHRYLLVLSHVLNRTLLLVALLAILPTGVSAQTTPKWSLGGTLFGVTYTSEAKSVDVALVSGGPLLPTGESSLRAAPEVYAGFFPHPNLVVAPGLAFAYYKPDGGDSSFGLAIDLALEWHFAGVAGNSFYAAVNGAYLSWDLGAGSDSDLTAGAAVGYRTLASAFFGLRFEAVYRRYFDLEENQITALIKAEVVFN